MFLLAQFRWRILGVIVLAEADGMLAELGAIPRQSLCLSSKQSSPIVLAMRMSMAL